MTSDASLFRWRKDSTTGETSDLVTDADVLKRAAGIVDASPIVRGWVPRGVDIRPAVVTGLRWLAAVLESEPSNGLNSTRNWRSG